jgi:hypothetical protein
MSHYTLTVNLRCDATIGQVEKLVKHCGGEVRFAHRALVVDLKGSADEVAEYLSKERVVTSVIVTHVAETHCGSWVNGKSVE